MKRGYTVAAVALLFPACSKQASDDRGPPPSPPNAPAPPAAPLPPAAPAAPTAPTAPTLDPRSTAAAEDLVRGFVRVLNAGRMNDAYMLLGPTAPPRSEFDREIKGYTHATQGVAGGQEGAAGSIYVSVPITFTGAGGRRRGATVVVRRANDVPGSTEAQRHWHIERLDWSRSDQPPST